MTPEEFRVHGHALIDWIADYQSNIGARPITSDAQPGEVRALIASRPPEEGEPFRDLIADLDRVVMPGITHWQHPGWFAYFSTGASGESVLAELVSAALGAQGMLWATSPALTEIEAAVMDWMVDLLGLPTGWRMDTGPGGGVLQMSASDATHLALVLARERCLSSGAAGRIEDLVVYSSSQAHSSVEKGAAVAGFRHVRPIEVDADFALDAGALGAAVSADVAGGLVPAFVCSAVGTTATGAVDSITAVADVAEAHGAWHHVDAAWAGSAMVCPEFRHLQPDLDRVDSYVTNPHKWLLTNFDCSTFWVADSAHLRQTMAIDPAYLATRGDVVNYRDWQVPLGRRFRALKLWWVLRSYGRSGLQDIIRQHCNWAAILADHVIAHPSLELAAPRSLALVTFAATAGDAATERIVEAVHETEEFAVTPTTLRDRRVIRVSVGAQSTTAQHVESLWGTIERAADDG